MVLFTSVFSFANNDEAESFSKGELEPFRPVDANNMPFSPLSNGVVPVSVVPSLPSVSSQSLSFAPSSTDTYDVTMTWGTVDFAQQYRLQRRLKGTSAWTVAHEGNVTRAELLSLTAGEHEFRVVGCLVEPNQSNNLLCEEVANWSDIATVEIGNESNCENCETLNNRLQSIAQNYAFEPYYYGQRKSTKSINASKAGNSTELTGTFLSNALQESNVQSANFVYGRIRVNADELTDWLGVDDIETAVQIIHTGGTNPAIFTQSPGGSVVYVEFDHVWAEVDGIQADASYQIKSVPTTKNLQIDAGARPENIMTKLLSAGVFADPDGILLPDLNQFDEFLEENQQMVREHLSVMPQLTYADYLASKEISTSGYKFGDDLPYDVVSINAKYTVPTNYVAANDIFNALPTLHRERLKIVTNGIEHTINMDEALDTSVVVDYVAASPQDKSTIDANGGLLNTPYKGVNLKPRLLINGAIAATGSAIAVGEYHELRVEMLDYGESTNICEKDSNVAAEKEDCRDIVMHNVTVGGVHAIALDGQYIDGAALETEAFALQGLSQTYSSNLLDSRFAGPLLSYLGRSYHRQLDIEVQNASASTGSLIFHRVNEAIISIDLSARLTPDGSYKMSVGSRRIDAPRNLFAIFPHEASDTYDTAPILFALGQAASALEHAVFAKAMGWPAESTMSILRFAANHEQSIYVVNQGNKNRLLPQLDYQPEVIANLTNLIDSGRIIIAPSGPQMISGWEGFGFIALNPETGAAAFIINGGAAGGEQPLGTLDQEETNSHFLDDVANIIDAISAPISAGVDGTLWGTYNENLYFTPLEQNAADGAAFISDFLVVGDIRNLGISSYEAAFSGGSLGDVAIAGVGFIPFYDIAKGGYKIADNALDLKGLDNIGNALGNITDASAIYLGNLSRHADILGATNLSLEGGVNSIVTNANRNGMNFSNVVVQDANLFTNSLGMNINNLTSTAAKGEFGERAAQSWAKSNGLTCYFCSADSSAKGFDNIFQDSAGNFIMSESKWVSSNTNVGVSTLSNTISGRQLSEDWMFQGGLTGDNALTRTPGLSPIQRQEILSASLNGKIKTQLVVVRPRHVGSGVTQRLTTDTTFGANGTETLGDIVIIEVPINP